MGGLSYWEASILVGGNRLRDHFLGFKYISCPVFLGCVELTFYHVYISTDCII